MTEASYLNVTQQVYDTVAVDYERIPRDELVGNPFDRAIFGVFAELVEGQVADLGCCPGRITGYLHGIGVDVFGIDLSSGMIEVARRRHPQLRFEVGSMTGLELEDDSLNGAVVWYSTVHTLPELLPRVFAECHRVLAPGGHLLHGFKVGDDQRLRRDRGYGHAVSFDVYWMRPERIADLLTKAGLVIEARLVHEPYESEKPSQGQ